MIVAQARFCKNTYDVVRTEKTKSFRGGLDEDREPICPWVGKQHVLMIGNRVLYSIGYWSDNYISSTCKVYDTADGKIIGSCTINKS